MKFTATEAQLKQIMANAHNAAAPVGMGMMQFIPGDKTADDFELTGDPGRPVSMDYSQGRMVKLCIRMTESGAYSMGPIEPSPDYQSWCAEYPTNRALAESAGCRIVEQQLTTTP